MFLSVLIVGLFMAGFIVVEYKREVGDARRGLTVVLLKMGPITVGCFRKGLLKNIRWKKLGKVSKNCTLQTYRVVGVRISIRFWLGLTRPPNSDAAVLEGNDGLRVIVIWGFKRL